MDGLQKLTPGRLQLDALAGWLTSPPLRLTLDPDARGRIEAAAELVAKAAAGEAVAPRAGAWIETTSSVKVST